MPDNYSADSLVASGSAAAPGAGGTVVTLALPTLTMTGLPGITPDPQYRVTIITGQEGTVDTANEANLRLTHGSTVVGTFPSGGQTKQIDLPRVTPGADNDLTLKAVNAFGVSSIVNATIVATRIS